MTYIKKIKMCFVCGISFLNLWDITQNAVVIVSARIHIVFSSFFSIYKLRGILQRCKINLVWIRNLCFTQINRRLTSNKKLI